MLVIFSTLLYCYLKKAYVSQLIVIANLIIFGLLCVIPKEDLYAVIHDLGCKPSFIVSPKFYTLFTHMYLHGDIFHIIMNMIILILIGVQFEEKISRKKFVFIYFFTGVCGSIVNAMFTYFAPNQYPDIIGIGASGAIFGIIGAYACMFPRDTVPAILGPIWLREVPIIIVAAVYLAIETLYVHFAPSHNVGHIVHIGGLLTGVIISIPLKTKLIIEKELKMNYVNLEQFANNQKLKELFEKIKTEDIPAIKSAWLTEFINNAKCINCQGELKLLRNYVVCTMCNKKIKINK